MPVGAEQYGKLVDETDAAPAPPEVSKRGPATSLAAAVPNTEGSMRSGPKGRLSFFAEGDAGVSGANSQDEPPPDLEEAFVFHRAMLAAEALEASDSSDADGAGFVSDATPYSGVTQAVMVAEASEVPRV